MNYISIISDDNYAPHTGALIYSIFNSNPDLDYKFFVLGYNFTKITLEKIAELSESINKEIEIINITSNSIPDLPVYRRYSFLIYVKLYLGYLLPSYVDWVLNLDVDTIVNGSLSDLFNFPEKEKYSLLAAEDYDGCDQYKKMSGLNIDCNYYNAGVCYFNLSFWRANHLSERCTDFIKSNKNIAMILEQGALSYVCKDTAYALPIKYNVLAGYYFYNPKVLAKYKNELIDSLTNPIIIHYAEPVKPWHINCYHPLKYLYIDSLRHTPWKDYKFEVKARRKVLHMINMKIRYFFHNIGIKKVKNFYIRLK